MPLNQISNVEQTSSSSVKNIRSKFESLTQQETNNESNDENLTPRSLIKKFELMSKKTTPQVKPTFSNSSSTSSITKSDALCSNKTPRISNSSIVETQNTKPKTIIERFESMASGTSFKNSNHSSSLTYISSFRSNSSRGEDSYNENKRLNDEEINEESKNNGENSEELSDEMEMPEETYSLSASDYTGSLMNQDELEEDYDDVDDDDEEEEDDEDFQDEYDSLDEAADLTNEITSEVTIKTSPEKLSYSADISNQQTSIENSVNLNSDLQPLSIQEYRKQKQKTVRRSSIMPRKEKKIAQKSLLAEESFDSKKFKYFERIKELEDLIKNEDNIIHQTGIALERCVNDFTATNEHIECNRILLISCQKRQAYSTEINRLKNLINSDKMDQKESVDLTGLLIFSDLQLPIKESYLNKLKSHEEKRIFYFLCLIRNGIQVLQTQVINVQELLSNKDTSLIFPNRMAINNVDVNFRVKIDIYTLEVLPNTNNKVKHSNSFFSPFKFHHQTNNQNHVNPYNFNEQQSSLTNQKAKTSNFIHLDTVEITKSDICLNKFKLNISSSSIPLSGVLYVNIRCMPNKSIELKGFMSVFEESATMGFGHWDRRWCFLNNYNISYWKYPEDEYKDGPLGVINLTKCIDEKISILPRDICARKHSIELLIEEESSDEYKRIRLSADSKDQADDWVTNINFALANLRLWNPKIPKK
ncbi:unnamed protein product [Brachionus calyciflorus]|uniref:PH domain-containing protein n=1 Tax=Brachionus calyciflorus TaxID=104777 RepID=A0A813Z260_9BILA|nr:unnamed protein product [Brachionus calyciflorus]